MEIIMLAAGGILYGAASIFLMQKKHMGGADVYMCIFIGLSLGFVAMTEAVIVACIAGIMQFMFNKCRKTNKKEYPFAPLLLAGVLCISLLRLFLY